LLNIIFIIVHMSVHVTFGCDLCLTEKFAQSYNPKLQTTLAKHFVLCNVVQQKYWHLMWH